MQQRAVLEGGTHVAVRGQQRGGVSTFDPIGAAREHLSETAEQRMGSWPVSTGLQRQDAALAGKQVTVTLVSRSGGIPAN